MKVLINTILFTFFSVAVLHAQTLSDLKLRQAEIEKKISNLNDIINQSNVKKSNLGKNIVLTQKKITLREELLSSIELEVEKYNQGIINTQVEQDSLLKRLDQRRKELDFILKKYSKFIKQDKFPFLLIFSSSSINQAYVRIKLYKKIISYYKETINSTKQIISEIALKQEKLETLYKELKLSQFEKEQEINNLKNEKTNYKNEYRGVERQIKTLMGNINKEKKNRIDIENKIKYIIAEEAKKLRKSSKLSAESNQLTKLFLSYKNKLMSPVTGGTIVSDFGEHYHPVLKTVKIRNNGVDIAVKEPDVKSVYEGVVKKVFNIPNSGYAVIIRHGKYLTVYSNLTSVLVKQGETVSESQNIGTLLEGDGKTEILHFELWNEKTPENPKDWLKDY
ncbi:MAG: peptidoglycan DD-metalloendopeptidase family protein [Bacteroidales bacterium]|nr:peptidoglycan DD-metalloendopeptidase family protein [Bacteroidales bacterium]HRX31221.1 peptidoglycan DD-metalloendopeptidase family protein [Tenuifilaceae bacterium]